MDNEERRGRPKKKTPGDRDPHLSGVTTYDGVGVGERISRKGGAAQDQSVQFQHHGTPMPCSKRVP